MLCSCTPTAACMLSCKHTYMVTVCPAAACHDLQSDLFKAGITALMVMMAEPRVPKGTKGINNPQQLWTRRVAQPSEPITLEPDKVEDFMAALTSSLQGPGVPLPAQPYCTHPADDPALRDVYRNVNKGTYASTVASNAAVLADRLLPRCTGYEELESLIK